MGPSGSGKSTAMNILGCLDVPTEGAYRFRGVDVGALTRQQRALLRRYYLGFVFQGFNLLNRTSALENVELPLVYRGMAAAERQRRAREALATVGLTGWESHTPAELSGGQMQRVAIARAIVAEPSVLFADEPTGNLDTARSIEIMELLVRLQPRAWHHGADGHARARHGGLRHADHPLPRRPRRERRAHGRAALMLFNAIVLALREIRRNVLRSSLTALGIIIGVASVIIMVTLGNGATAQVTADIANMGSNLLTRHAGPARRTRRRVRQRQAVPSAGCGRARRATCRRSPSVAPVSTIGLSVISGAKNRSTTITGTTNEYFESGNWTLASGRFFSDSELRSGAAVCIIGADHAQGAARRAAIRSAAGSGCGRCRARSSACSQSKGKSNFGQDRDDTVVIPIRTMQRRLAGNDDIHQMQLSVRTSTSSEKAQQDIFRLMRERRHLARDADDDFSIMDQQEIANTISGTTRTLTALLAAVAAISLLVGGIGIMNIMLVSVTERTREIGIRLAIGAFERDVLTQFLVEAVVLSVFGGAIGIGLALTASCARGRCAGPAVRARLRRRSRSRSCSLPPSASCSASFPRVARPASIPSTRSAMNSGRHDPVPSCCTWLILVVLLAGSGAGCGVRRPYVAPTPVTPIAWEQPAPQRADLDALSRWWETVRRRTTDVSRPSSALQGTSMCGRRSRDCAKRAPSRLVRARIAASDGGRVQARRA